jgi:hypothetical protein
MRIIVIVRDSEYLIIQDDESHHCVDYTLSREFFEVSRWHFGKVLVQFGLFASLALFFLFPCSQNRCGYRPIFDLNVR